MKTLAALLILLFASTAFAGVRPDISREHCEPIRDFVFIPTYPVKVDSTRLALLKDKDLLCFAEVWQKIARDEYSIREAEDWRATCQNPNVDDCGLEDYYLYLQRKKQSHQGTKQ